MVSQFFSYLERRMRSRADKRYTTHHSKDEKQDENIVRDVVERQNHAIPHTSSFVPVVSVLEAQAQAISYGWGHEQRDF